MDGRATTKRAARATTTDPEARVMKMADGGSRPASNVQLAADTRSGAVAGVAGANVGSDLGRRVPMSDALATAYGRRPGEHLADGGFAKLDDIETLAEIGVTAYVPVRSPAPRPATATRRAPTIRRRWRRGDGGGRPTRPRPSPRSAPPPPNGSMPRPATAP